MRKRSIITHLIFKLSKVVCFFFKIKNISSSSFTVFQANLSMTDFYYIFSAAYSPVFFMAPTIDLNSSTAKDTKIDNSIRQRNTQGS